MYDLIMSCVSNQPSWVRGWGKRCVYVRVAMVCGYGVWLWCVAMERGSCGGLPTSRKCYGMTGHHALNSRLFSTCCVACLLAVFRSQQITSQPVVLLACLLAVFRSQQITSQPVVLLACLLAVFRSQQITSQPVVLLACLLSSGRNKLLLSFPAP